MNMKRGRLNMKRSRLNMKRGRQNIQRGRLTMKHGRQNMKRGRVNMKRGRLNMPRYLLIDNWSQIVSKMKSLNCSVVIKSQNILFPENFSVQARKNCKLAVLHIES
jgi:hypothetical protein